MCDRQILVHATKHTGTHTHTNTKIYKSMLMRAWQAEYNKSWKIKILKTISLKLTDKICSWPQWHQHAGVQGATVRGSSFCWLCVCFGRSKCNKIRKWNKFDLIPHPQINVLAFRERQRFTNTTSMRCTFATLRTRVSGRAPACCVPCTFCIYIYCMCVWCGVVYRVVDWVMLQGSL